MRLKIFLPVMLFLIAASAESSAYTVSETQGAEQIVIGQGDTISGICGDLLRKQILPAGMTAGRCTVSVLRKNLSDDPVQANEWAKLIKPGDNLFFPAKARAEYEALWLGKIEQSLKERDTANSEKDSVSRQLAEKSGFLDKAEMQLVLWRTVSGVLIVIGFIMLLLLIVRRRGWDVLPEALEERPQKTMSGFRSVRSREAAPEADLNNWKPGSSIKYVVDLPEGGSVEAVFKVLGSKLKKNDAGQDVPCLILQSPYEPTAAVDSFPENNVRNHVRKHAKKVKEQNQAKDGRFTEPNPECV